MSPTNYTTMVPSSTSHEKARHSTRAYLGKFYKYPLKLSNNQAKLSKQSLTAHAAIRIVLLTLQGCTATHTHTHQLLPGSGTLQAGTGEDVATKHRPQLCSSTESHLS